MATYSELFALSSSQPLIQRLTVAVAVEADVVRLEDPATAQHAERMAWAKRALDNPDGMARQLLLCALAQNRAADVATIEAADDVALQAAVTAAIALLL